MLDTLLATIAILVTWAVWGCALVALGAAVFPSGIARRRCERSSAEGFDADRDDAHADLALRLLVWFWAGWCAVVTFLQLWHLAFPVDGRAAGVLGCIALAAAFMRRRELLAAVARESLSRSTIVVAAAIALFWANLATGEIRITDTGLYHMQAARWNAAFPIVHGLGNLHGRLAYNNASLLYAAVVDVDPWAHRGHHVANGLLALAVVLPLAASIPKALAVAYRSDDRAAHDWLRHVARSLLVVPTLLHAYKHVTSLSPDLPVAMLGTAIAVVLIELCLVRPGVRRTAAGDRDGGPLYPTAAIAFVALLSATAIAVKLSMIATGGVATLVALWLVRPTVVRCALAAILFAAAVGPWCVRGAILSGYLAYPSQAVALDVPWRVPQEWAEEDRRTIVAWARDADRNATDVLADWSWVGPWFLRQAKDVLGVTLPLLVIVACAALIARDRQLSRPNERSQHPSLWPAALPSVAAIVFLLATAPNLARFGGTSLWLIAVVAATTWLGQRRGRAGAGSAEFRHAWRAAITLSALLAVVAASKIGRYVRVVGPVAPIPEASLRTVRTDSGLEVNVPIDSDRAWDAPLPSTPYAKPRLSLRREGELSAGFEHREPE